MAKRPGEFDETEQEATEALLRFYSVVRSWGNNPNEAELVAAIHVCQSFITQRMLHRLNPDQWANWYDARPNS